MDASVKFIDTTIMLIKQSTLCRFVNFWRSSLPENQLNEDMQRKRLTQLILFYRALTNLLVIGGCEGVICAFVFLITITRDNSQYILEFECEVYKRLQSIIKYIP